MLSQRNRNEILKKLNHEYLIQTLSDKAFNGTVVNLALPSWQGLLKLRLMSLSDDDFM